MMSWYGKRERDVKGVAETMGYTLGKVGGPGQLVGSLSSLSATAW